MALIWRSIVDVNDGAIKSTGPQLVEAWLQHKTRSSRDGIATLPEPGQKITFHTRHQSGNVTVDVPNQLSVLQLESDEIWAHRTIWTEHKLGENVRSTITFVRRPDRSAHAWVDVERFGAQAFTDPWIPFAPGVVANLLRSTACSRGGTELQEGVRVLAREHAGRRLAAELLNTARTIPFVIVSPTRDEYAQPGLGAARERAEQFQHRLRGIAPVVLLDSDAVDGLKLELSNELGDGFSVYGGAARCYLPGLDRSSSQWTHRFVAWHLRGRSVHAAAERLAPSIQRAACAQPLPGIWTPELEARLRGVPEGGSTEHRELLDLADHELSEADRKIRALAEELRDTKAELEAQQQTLANAQRQIDDAWIDAGVSEEENESLRAYIRYLEPRAAHNDDAVAHDASTRRDDVPSPDTCSEIPHLVNTHLLALSYPESAWGSAEDLDRHASTAWAKRAWRALRTLNAYAQKKVDSGFDGNFLQFCESGEGEWAAKHVALRESETTDRNPKFRDPRTLPIDQSVAVGPTVYMPAHIKVVNAGPPAPRIHFYDDTGGPTGKVHIGYFGEHLPNSNTN